MRKTAAFAMGTVIAVTGLLGVAAPAGASPTLEPRASEPSPNAICEPRQKHGIGVPDGDLVVVGEDLEYPCGYAAEGSRYYTGCVLGGLIQLQSDSTRWGWVPRDQITVVEGEAPPCYS